MKLINAIVEFFKNLFGKKTQTDGNCNECEVKEVCQTIDKEKKY